MGPLLSQKRGSSDAPHATLPPSISRAKSQLGRQGGARRKGPGWGHLGIANYIHIAENWEKAQAAKVVEQDRTAIAERAVGAAWLHMPQIGCLWASGPEMIATLAKDSA